MTTNTGDCIVRGVLSEARRAANNRRLRGRRHDEFAQGMAHGQIIIAENYLDADPLVTRAAHNELHFLHLYTEGRA